LQRSKSRNARKTADLLEFALAEHQNFRQKIDTFVKEATYPRPDGPTCLMRQFPQERDRGQGRGADNRLPEKQR
jgi:hypothetical protein